MRLLLVSLLAASMPFVGNADANEQTFVQINLPVRDVNQACKHYSTLGFEANKDCETCHLVVVKREGVRMTLWPDVEGAGVDPRHLDVVVTSNVDAAALTKLGAEITPSTERPGCQTVTDADGYQVDVCFERPVS